MPPFIFRYMKYLKAFINIPKPNPPNIPVINLKTLLLSLNSKNCVVPSIADGTNNRTAKMSKNEL